MLKKLFISENKKVLKKQAKRDRNACQVEPEELDGFMVVNLTESRADHKTKDDEPPSFESLNLQSNMGAQQSASLTNNSSPGLDPKTHINSAGSHSTDTYSSDAVRGYAENDDVTVPRVAQPTQCGLTHQTVHDDIEFTLSPQLCALLDSGSMMRDHFAIQPLKEYDCSKYEYDFSLEKSVLREMNM